MHIPSAAPGARGKVWFVGAGPGDPELITLKGQRLLAQAGAVLFAGSLVNEAVTRFAPAGCEVRDSSRMALQEMTDWLTQQARRHATVVWLQTGDPPILRTILPMKVYLLEVSNGLSDAISILFWNSSLASWISPNSASWLFFKVGNICAMLPDEKNAAKPTPSASPRSLNLAFGSISFSAKPLNTGPSIPETSPLTQLPICSFMISLPIQLTREEKPPVQAAIAASAPIEAYIARGPNTTLQKGSSLSPTDLAPWTIGLVIIL